ncbi:MAG TPA: DUF5674 family protein [Patescibacteria group bacterium]|nr:DUF5674 family protein [Patescibacteria group bacterium]
MKIINQKITLEELKNMSQKMFGNFVKAVVDIERETMAVDAPMHADEEAELLKNGSRQENLWGINLYPEKEDNDFVEFDSMINLRPNQNNRTRGIDNQKLREKIVQIVNKLVQK